MLKVIYLKELTSIEEMFQKNSKLPIVIKQGILLLKKIFFIVTIDEQGVCILPYKTLKPCFKIKLFFLKKILKKLHFPVVLSNNLAKIEELKKMISILKIEQVEGRKLANYLLPEMIEYVCSKMKEEKEKQEITLLIENKTTNITKLIIELAGKVRRIQIVTPKIGQFETLENELEEKFGIACQITNNKRKSLLKSKIIVNLDYSEELFNQFRLNPKAIVFDINTNINIYSKAFIGIHVYDYQISSDNMELTKEIFEIKKLYEAKTLGNNYEQVRKIIEQDHFRITSLIGRNGNIHQSEYLRICR